MERPVKDGILYVQHSKFGKVKGGFGVGRGFSQICHDSGPGAGPSAAREGGTGARPFGAAFGGALGSAASQVGLSLRLRGLVCVGQPCVGSFLLGHRVSRDGRINMR